MTAARTIYTWNSAVTAFPTMKFNGVVSSAVFVLPAGYTLVSIVSTTPRGVRVDVSASIVVGTANAVQFDCTCTNLALGPALSVSLKIQEGTSSAVFGGNCPTTIRD